MTRTLCFLFVLLVEGCTSNYFFSLVIFDLGENKTEAAILLNEKIETEIEKRGGVCKFTSHPLPRRTCDVDFSDVYRIMFWTDENLEFNVSISSFYGSFFPLSEKSIKDGKFLPNGVRKEEDWIVELAKPVQVIRVWRSGNSIEIELPGINP